MKFILKFKDGMTYFSNDIEEINGIPCVAGQINETVEDQGFLSLFLRDQEKDEIELVTDGGKKETKSCNQLYSVEIIL